MGLRHLKTLLLAGTILTVVSVPAQAEAVSTVIGLTAIISATLSVSAATAATIGGFLISTALSVGLSLAANALSAGTSQGPASGTTLQTQYGGVIPRSAICGHQIVEGHRVYANVYGVENKHLQVVEVIGDGLHDSLTRIWYNGKECPIYPHPSWDGVSNPETYFVDHRGLTEVGTPLPIVGVDPKVYMRFYRGEWGQTADTNLVMNANPPDRWTSAHRGRGICYAAFEQEWSEEEGLTGFPTLRYEVKGRKLYDLRYDDTNGGEGDQRWGDESTYVWSDNPPVIEYNFRRGFFLNGQRILGMGVSAADLIHTMYLSAANDCDDAIPLAAGGTEPRYRCNLTVSNGQLFSKSLESIRDSMAGYTVERAGQFGPIAGVAQTVRTELTFTDDDLLEGEQVEFSKYRSRSDTTTAVYGSFSDPRQKGEYVSFPVREDPADDLAMGERLEGRIDLSQVRSVSQAQRIAEIYRRRSLLQPGGSVPLRGRWLATQPGDWLTWNSAQHGSMTVEVMGTTLDADHKTRLTFQAISSTVFSWSTAGELEGPFIPTGPRPGTLITAASGVDANSVSMPADNGLVHPGIKFTWTAIADPSVDCLQFEIRQDGDTEVIPFRADFPLTGLAVATAGIQAATLYEYRHRLVTTPERTCPWSAWFTVTSGADHIVPTTLRVVPGGVDIDALEQDIRDQIQDGVDALDSIEVTRPIVLALRDSVSSVEAVRVQAMQTGLVEPGIYQVLDQIGQGVMRLALQAERTESLAQEIGAENHNGRWVLRGVKDVENTVNEVSIIADLNTASIQLRATHTELTQGLAAAAAGLEPAVGWNWNGTVEGWTVTNGTLTPGAGYVDFAATGASARMDSPTISVDANVYKVVRFNAVRTAGAGWGVTLSWGPGYSVTQAFVIPDSPGSTSSIALDLTSVPEWTGTITGLRVSLATGTTVRFSVGQVGNNALAALLVSGLQGQITEVSAELDALEGDIQLKANQITVDDLGVTLGQALLDISAAESAILARALHADLTTTISRLTTAELLIDALNSSISFTIEQVQSPLLLDILGRAAIGNALNEERTQAEHQALVARAHFFLGTKITDEGEVRSTAIQQLNARVQDSEAVAFLEQQARATADFAEATARSLLAARHDTDIASANASIASEMIVRASADLAEASLRQSVQANLTTAEAALTASINSEATARSDADSAEAAARQTVAASVVTETNSRIAAVTSEATARADADSAEAALRESVSVIANANTAAIITEQTARANADSAEATARQQVQANVDTEVSNRTAAVASEATARANADNAEAALRIQVQANLTTETTARIAAVNSEATARADADAAEAALRSQVAADLSTETTARIAAVNTEATARADADSAEAAARTAVSVTVGNHTASITTLQSATATIDGKLNTRWQIISNSSGHISGMYSNNDGATSNLIFQADNFFVIDADVAGATAQLMFAIQSIDGTARFILNGNAYVQKLVAGTINAANIIVDNLVVTGHLATGAAAAVKHQSHANGGVGANTEQTIVSVALTIVGGVAHVVYDNAKLSMDGTAGAGALLRWFIDGVAYDNGGGGDSRPTDSTAIGFTGVSWSTPVTIGRVFSGLSNGSHTFSLRFWANATGLGYSAGTLYVQELRKPGVT